MRYFLVSDITYSYDVADYVGQQLYSAESEDELFKFIYKRPADYEITEDDLWDKPVREKYKSDRGYAQAVGYWASSSR